MDITQQTSDEQTRLWNGHAGRAWVEMQAVLDRMFAPFEALLVDAVDTARPARVLDIGCGTGSTTLAVARRLGPQGQCQGIDLSAPMIAAARARAEREALSAGFFHADAQTHAFEPAGFDLLISRFGVTFFDDPVRAFANLRRAARPGADARLIAWRSGVDNPFMTTAERAAAPLLPNLPARRPNAPGQFAFADRDRVLSILAQSGWADLDIRPIDVPCVMPEQDLIPYLSLLGPVGLALRQTDEPTRRRVIETARAAFVPYVQGAEVRFSAACWMIGARAPRVTEAGSRL